MVHGEYRLCIAANVKYLSLHFPLSVYDVNVNIIAKQGNGAFEVNYMLTEMLSAIQAIRKSPAQRARTGVCT